ncbi:MAG: hypothetical protein ACUVSF_13975, partial [Anaerolineae bacterium]
GQGVFASDTLPSGRCPPLWRRSSCSEVGLGDLRHRWLSLQGCGLASLLGWREVRTTPHRAATCRAAGGGARQFLPSQKAGMHQVPLVSITVSPIFLEKWPRSQS